MGDLHLFPVRGRAGQADWKALQERRREQERGAADTVSVKLQTVARFLAGREDMTPNLAVMYRKILDLIAEADHLAK